MKLQHIHPWDVSPAEAIAIQQRLRNQVCLEDCMGDVCHVAGVDVGFEQHNSVTRAVLAVLSFPGLELKEYAVAPQPTRFPYIPGLLSFREIPAVLEALAKLRQRPELLFCDGQGIAHPRRFGIIACHLGVLTGIPSIGVAKTRLVGSHDDVPDERGSWVPLRDKGDVIGAALRSRSGVRPLCISSGHCVTLSTALHYVMACLTRLVRYHS